MALSGVGTYLPTLKEFIVHWNTMNVAIGERVTLAGGFGIQDLEAIRQELGSAIQTVNQCDATREDAQKKKDALLSSLRDRVKQFRASIASQLPDSAYRKSAPTLPTFTAAGKLQLDSLCSLVTQWEKLNEDTSLAPWKGPVKLAGGYTVAQAQADITTLRTAFTIYNASLESATKARAQRSELMKGVATRLRQYRQSAIANLPSGHPLLQNVPAVAPTANVTGPESVMLNGEWDDTRHAAVLSWTAAEGNDHERFEVRYHPGPKYRDSEEQVVGSVLKGVLSVITDYGMSAPGSMAYFKVYNVTTSGEERGSNALKILRSG
jgi:hypothetical protein